MNDYLSEVFGDGGIFARQFPDYERREGQVQLARMVDEATREGTHALGEGPCGCHVAGQEILIADGRSVAVENIQVGDRLMGPGRDARTVLALLRGEQETAEVVPTKGAPWRVNLDHVLTLVRTDNGETVDVRVRDWLDWSKGRKALHKLFRAPVKFPRAARKLPLDPYFLGVLLGDGSLSSGSCVAITKCDDAIVALAEEQARIHGLRVRRSGITSHIVGPIGNRRNPVLTALRDLGVHPTGSENKFIPFQYKTASRSDRLQVLAGLLDTDGSLSNSCYDFISKSRRLADDVAFVARSLGLAAYVKPCQKGCQNGFVGTYYRVSVSGETSDIPCRIPRKQAPARKQIKDVLLTGFTIERTGQVEPYFGFTLDGDGRYLLADFTVTHNSGKSVAYSVPAIWHAHHRRKRVIIATASIPLQEQLIAKDLPMLSEVLPWTFKFALLKGRGNYLCVDALEESTARGDIHGLGEFQKQMDEVLAWSRLTELGDMSELPIVPSQRVWSRLSVTGDECKGDGCEFRDQCFYEGAKANAKDADIIVTNFHLLCAHIALRAETGMDMVLPAFDALVIDEAHELADVAREFFGFSVGEFTVTRLARRAADLGNPRLAATLREQARELFARIASFADSAPRGMRLKAPGFVSHGRLDGALERLADLAERRVNSEGATDDERAAAARTLRLARLAGSRLREAVEQSDEGKVYWVERDARRRVTLRAKPVEVADLLRRELFDRTASVSLVSATLTTSGTFDFVRREVGVPRESLELTVESPFDFAAQALLVVPCGMPDPRAPEFTAAVADTVKRVVHLCDGRTLGLFTSHRHVEAVYEALAGGDHRVLRQGEMPRTELTRVFRDDVHSVLLGTTSFWTGVDVPGESLSAVVIDRLPFPTPDDPVLDVLAERNPNAFFDELVPRAILLLRQGVGRLIRRASDVGVVVICDRRLVEKGYGREFLRSLPPMSRSAQLEAIEVFMFDADLAKHTAHVPAAAEAL